MPNVSLNKSAFLSVLDQFRADPPFEAQIVHHVVNNMPDNLVSAVVEELYFTRVYADVYYKVQHATLPDTPRYFMTKREVVAYLDAWNYERKRFTQGDVTVALRTGKWLFGFKIEERRNF